MDTVNSLQTQVQNISNWFSSLGRCLDGKLKATPHNSRLTA